MAHTSNINPAASQRKRRLIVDSDDEDGIGKAKRPRQDLSAELDDLHIDMEGWIAAEEAPRRQRRRR
ncbi:hypothetical protein J4E91_005920 [Alternaria rosae]|nr:hypothetical protein J4E91_005920 [Alternaria rosae]